MRFMMASVHGWLSAVVATRVFEITHHVAAIPFYLAGAGASFPVVQYLLDQFSLARQFQRIFKPYEHIIDVRVPIPSIVIGTLILSSGSYFSLFALTATTLRLFRDWYLTLHGATEEGFRQYSFWCALTVFTMLLVAVYPHLSRMGSALLQDDLQRRMCETPDEFLPQLHKEKLLRERRIEHLVERERLEPLEIVEHESVPRPRVTSVLYSLVKRLKQ